MNDDFVSELERLHPASFGWALSCAGWDRDEAEEVLQVTYLKIIEGKARFEGRSTLKTWLFSVIRRTAAERRRNRILRTLSLAKWFEGRPVAPPAAGPESNARDRQTGHELRRALSRLPRMQREVLHLVFYEDLTIEAAAEVLGVSLGTARTHYQRGKTRMRQLLPPGTSRELGS